MGAPDEYEIETVIEGTPDNKEMTITFKSDRKLTIEAIVLELEYLINQFARADDEKAQGAAEH